MAPRRKSMKSRTKGKQPSRKATTRYVVSATFKMQTAPISKTEADKWAAKVKRNGGTSTMKKV